MVGKADESQVLKKAKKVDWRAKVVEVKKGEAAEKKVEEKKKEDPKKKEEPNTTWTNNPLNYYPYYPPYHYPYPAPPPAFQADGSYRPSQAYPPHYYQYPETDYTYYNYPNNPRYLTHIRHSWAAAITTTQNNPHYLTYIKHSWAFSLYRLCSILQSRSQLA